jgi:uncharacterized protein
MKLKYKVTDIPPQGLDLDLDIPPEKAASHLSSQAPDGLKLAGPLTGQLQVMPTGRKVIVRGSIMAPLLVECARCLEHFEYTADEEIFVVFTSLAETDDEEELRAEELNQEIFSGEEIELWPIIEEHLVLGLPFKMLCSEDCRGLCLKCGKNLNQDACECVTASGHPGLAALEKIRDKLPN